MEEEKKKREFDPITGTFPKSNIICKDCVFRDRTMVKLDGKEKAVGITKSFCDIYLPPPKTNGKPMNVLFHGEDCKYYRKE